MAASLRLSLTNASRQLPRILFQVFLVVTVATASGCYYSANDTILPSPGYVSPCGTSSNCCAVQSENVCLSDAICYIPGSDTYYLSPCTDPTYSAPECPLYCSNRTDIDELNIVYNSQERLWYCCSTNADGTANCSDPTNETFSGPPPNELSTIFPSSSSSTLSSTSSDVNVPASSTQSTSQNTSQSTSQSTSQTSQSISQSPISTTSNPVTSPSSTTTVNSSGGSGNGLSSKGTIALTVSLGVPSTVAAIAGAYFAYLAVQKKRAKLPITGSARPSRP